MAKKPEPVFTITKAELKKLPRNQQRFYLDQGLVKDAPQAKDSK